MNEIIDDQESESIAQAHRISDLNKKVTKLGKDVQRFKRADLGKLVLMSKGKVDIGVERKSADFEYELMNAKAFLKGFRNRFSRYFIANHLAWYLSVCVKGRRQKKFLAIYLHSESYADELGDWSIEATYGLSILIQSGSQSEDKLKLDTAVFGTKTSLALGWPKFISLQDLRAGGYIKSDKIKIQVHLELGKLIRTQ